MSKKRGQTYDKVVPDSVEVSSVSDRWSAYLNRKST